MKPADSAENDFRTALAGVKRMPASDRLPAVAQSLPLPHPRQKMLDEAAVMAELMQEPQNPEDFESGDTLIYRGEGIQDSVWKKLRRGQFRVQDECDLHGLNRDDARLEIVRFLARCADQGHRCVRIIHGKGNGSPNSGPVIKRHLDGWLRKRRDVLAFCSARSHDGGTGAVYVLLRSL
ncbi:MAG: Smr/MutS family protein [Pseudomonadota bacterium]